ncbi:hypothetical protein [Streptomyces sp. NPDC047869]|uniref:hypothetical protein n=1 Tax=Streptomyces sp. NPDC047869 TaxID=3154709 RepID=UPI0034551946
MRRSKQRWRLRCLALGAALLAVVPFASTSEASTQPPSATAAFTPNPNPSAQPSSRPAAGPERAGLAAAAANGRPKSGSDPQAGPPFKKSGSTWQADRSTAMQRFPTFARQLRLLDQDLYFVRTPGFEKCDADKAVVTCDIR